MTKDDLDLVETERLIEALCRRFDACLFVYKTKDTNNSYEYNFLGRAESMELIGMCEYVKAITLHRTAATFFKAQLDGGDDE